MKSFRLPFLLAQFLGFTVFVSLVQGAVLMETDFEGSPSLPTGWTQSQVSGGATWQIQSGSGGGNPSSAHGGTGNATLYLADYGDNSTRLISPVFWSEVYESLSLTFWHTQAEWSPDQDEL